MGRSFSLKRVVMKSSPRNLRVLVTGGAGNIGSYFAEHAHQKYDLRLMVHPSNPPERVDKIRPFGEIVVGDMLDLPRMKELCAGMDVVLHLAANAGSSDVWRSLLQTNIVGTYNTFVAAKAAGVRRIVFASTIHAVSGYPRDVQVSPDDPVNPGDLYGVSKCFGEALARYMAEQEGVAAIVLRIGGWASPEAVRGERAAVIFDAFVSPADLQQIIEKSIEAEHLQFGIFHALSDNTFKRMDITSAREVLGYEPGDDPARENETLRALNLRETIATHNLSDKRQKSGLREDLG